MFDYGCGKFFLRDCFFVVLGGGCWVCVFVFFDDFEEVFCKGLLDELVVFIEWW